jgi:hypothetical protein
MENVMVAGIVLNGMLALVMEKLVLVGMLPSSIRRRSSSSSISSGMSRKLFSQHVL